MQFDVVVVGASTAGLYTAQLLAEAGLEVGVFEAGDSQSPARRTLIVTPAFGKVLNSGMPEAVTLHGSRVIRVEAGNATDEVCFRIPDPIIERASVLRKLAHAVRNAGAAIFYGWKFLRFDQGTALFQRRDDPGSGEKPQRVSASRAFVGADGALGKVGPAAGVSRPPCVPILQAEVELPRGWDSGTAQVWFDIEQTPYFFWLIPQSDSEGVVGLIGGPDAALRRILDRFLAKHDLTPIAYQGARVAMHHPKLKPWGRAGKIPVLLVGDAAGQVKVTTVGGTVTGLAGALAAARSILDGTTYARELRSLKRELDLHWWIRKALGRLDSKGYEEMIRLLSGPVKRFLAKHDRDSMAPVFWKLLFLEPRLLKTGLRCLLRSKDRSGVA